MRRVKSSKFGLEGARLLVGSECQAAKSGSGETLGDSEYDYGTFADRAKQQTPDMSNSKIRVGLELPQALALPRKSSEFGSREEWLAFEELSTEFADLKRKLEATSYVHLYREFEYALRQDEGELVNEHLRKVDGYLEGATRINDVCNSLRALAHLAKGDDTDSILRVWAPAPSWVQGEILRLFSWFGEHRRLLREGHALPLPFRGVTASRGEPGRKVDREYYQLGLFLAGFQIHEGTALLVCRKGETPDFHVLDPSGKLIGVECSEVPLSQEWADEMDAKSRIYKGIDARHKIHPASCEPKEPRSWLALEPHLPDMINWLHEILGDPRLTGGGEIFVVHQPSGFEVRVGRDLGRTLSSFEDGISGGTLAQLESKLAKGVVKAVEKKLYKSNSEGLRKARQPPSVKPCHLVLYPNCDWPTDLSSVCAKVNGRLPKDWRSYFDRAWLVAERGIVEVRS